MRFINLLLSASLVLVASPMALADDYYDDDIYYDASKAKKKTSKNDYQSSTGYDYGYSSSSSTRDVDEYNRRGGDYNQAEGVVYDSILTQDGYIYTNRIERFYNPNVVSGSGDSALIYSYNENQPVVNIYIDDFWDPYPFSGWSWSWGYSTPWYYTSSVWNPYWTYYGWYNPWSWSWGWGWTWPCHDYYHHHHHPYPPHGGHHAHHGGYYGGSYRHTSPGAYRTHNSSSATRFGRGGATTRPGYSAGRSNSTNGNPAFGTWQSTTRGRNNAVGTSQGADNKGSVTHSKRGNGTRPSVAPSTNNSGSKRESGNYTRQSGSSSKSSGDSYSRSGRSSSRSSGSYSRPSGGSSRSSGGFSGGGSRGGGGGRGRR